MRQLREFELWLEVEKPLAKGRMLNAPGQTSQSGGIHRPEKKGDSRDEAAKRVGFKSGSDAEKALKALKAADQPCCS